MKSASNWYSLQCYTTSIVLNKQQNRLKFLSYFSLRFFSIFILLSSFYFVSVFVMKLSNMQANVFTLIIYIVYVVSLIKNPKI